MTHDCEPEIRIALLSVILTQREDVHMVECGYKDASHLLEPRGFSRQPHLVCLGSNETVRHQ